jgi:hypothetical protein
LLTPFARGRAHSAGEGRSGAHHKRGVEHPQMRNGSCSYRSHVGVLAPRVGGRNGTRHKQEVEHPQVRDGSCSHRSHVGVLTPRAREGPPHSFGCRNPRRRRTRLRSGLATGRSLSKERRTCLDFFVRLWLRRFFSRRSLWFPVTLNRFAVDLCVFILGIVLVLQISSRAPQRRKVRKARLRRGWRSFLRALHAIWRARSRVTPSLCPTSSRV